MKWNATSVLFMKDCKNRLFKYHRPLVLYKFVILFTLSNLNKLMLTVKFGFSDTQIYRRGHSSRTA